jgi:triphosphatase
MIEVELKYKINDKDTAESIWRDSLLTEIEEAGSRKELIFKSAYFDTEDGVLAKNDMAFRVRLEGARVIASLKSHGKNEGALHEREEINVPIDGATCLITPDPNIFNESEIGRQMVSLIGEKTIASIMEVGFLRRSVRVDIGESIVEAAIDIGEIVADAGASPICELELELFSGNHDDLFRLGKIISERHALIPEERSKYARGLMLTRCGSGAL